LVDVDLLGQRCCVVAAQPSATVWCDAEAKVADSDLQLGATDYVGDCGCDARVDLGRTVYWRVGFVVKADEEDARNER
jgi:hypothetical protein